MPERKQPAKAEKGDIALPNQSGRVDPRLRKPKSLNESIKDASEGFKTMIDKFGK